MHRRFPRRPPRASPARPCPQPAQTRELAPARWPPKASPLPTAAPPWPPRPLLHTARALSAPSAPSAARPSPMRRARLGHDGRRAPTARTRRATSFSIILAGLQTRGKRHGRRCRVRSLCARRRGCTRSAQAPRSGGDRRSRSRRFESAAHQCANVAAPAPRGSSPQRRHQLSARRAPARPSSPAHASLLASM